MPRQDTLFGSQRVEAIDIVIKPLLATACGRACNLVRIEDIIEFAVGLSFHDAEQTTCCTGTTSSIRRRK